MKAVAPAQPRKHDYDDDLDHVRLTRSFLQDPQRFPRHLLDDD